MGGILVDAFRFIERCRKELDELDSRTKMYWCKFLAGTLGEIESVLLETEIKNSKYYTRISSPVEGINQIGVGVQHIPAHCDPTAAEAPHSQASGAWIQHTPVDCHPSVAEMSHSPASETSGIWELPMSDQPVSPGSEVGFEIPSASTPFHDSDPQATLRPEVNYDSGAGVPDSNASHDFVAPAPPNVYLEMVDQWEWRAPHLSVL